MQRASPGMKSHKFDLRLDRHASHPRRYNACTMYTALLFFVAVSRAAPAAAQASGLSCVTVSSRSAQLRTRHGHAVSPRLTGHASASRAVTPQSPQALVNGIWLLRHAHALGLASVQPFLAQQQWNFL